METLSKLIDAKEGQYESQVNTKGQGLDFFTIDLIVQSPHAPRNSTAGVCEKNAPDFLKHHVFAEYTESLQIWVIKLLLAGKDGYVSRSDMIEFRMHGLNAHCHSFVTPRQFVRAAERQQSALLLKDYLPQAIGLIWQPSPVTSMHNARAICAEIESSLRRRLALPWLLPDPIPYRRVALVGGLEEPKSFATVKAMGIGLIVLDKPGNILEDPQGAYAHLREEFIPFNMSPDEHAAQRILDAVREKQVDGIHTRYDIHHTNVAKACRMLGLPTSDPKSYAIATDKFAARLQEPDKNSAFRVSDTAELLDVLPTLHLQYPLVVKPAIGRNSWGVLRCDSEEQLIEATRLAYDRLIGVTEEGNEIHSSVMIEPYVDGPEFDADLVLWDGELLFYEVSDNYPCAGDINAPASFSHQQQTQRDFQETLFVYPSILQEDEQKLLVRSLHETVLRLGFRHGVFHVEARLRNSKMEYAIQDGRVDLRVRKTCSNQSSPSCFLIETNPRPPGYLSLLRAGWMYGIDYWALHVLRCINDEVRYRAFSVVRERDEEHFCALHFIMPEDGGILKSGDPGEELAMRRPDLMASIPLYYNEFKIGQFVPPPVSSNFMFLTRMAVESHKGRDHLLDVIQDIRREWVFEIGT